MTDTCRELNGTTFKDLVYRKKCCLFDEIPTNFLFDWVTGTDCENIKQKQQKIKLFCQLMLGTVSCVNGRWFCKRETNHFTISSPPLQSPSLLSLSQLPSSSPSIFIPTPPLLKTVSISKSISISLSLSPTLTPTPLLCPNGVINPGEECDDGNMIDNDGCESNCLFSPFIDVSAQLISGVLTGCSTSISNTGRKVAVDGNRNLYAAFKCGSTLYVVTDIQRGQSWQTPINTGFVATEYAIEGASGNGLYLTWLLTGSLYFSKSIDRGQTWSTQSLLTTGVTSNQISIVAFGDYVCIGVQKSTTVVLFINNNQGVGLFTSTTIVLSSLAFLEVMIDKSNENVIVGVDVPTFHLFVSTDHGATFGPDLVPPGQAYYSDWAIGNGYVYVVGGRSSDTTNNLDVIPISNVASSVTRITLQPNRDIERAVDSDNLGNAYIVTAVTGTSIGLDRYVQGAASINAADARTIGSVGTNPHVKVLPSNTGALVIFANAGQVFAAIEVYP